MATADATYDILIAIRDRLDGLDKAQRGVKNLGNGLDDANAKSSKLKEGLATGFGMELARRGIDLVTHSLQAAVGEAFRYALEVKNVGQAMNLSSEAVQVLRDLVEDTGGSFGSLQQALNQQMQSLSEARNLSSAAARAYEDLGLSARAIEALPVERRFELIARAMVGASDQTKAYNAATVLLGSRSVPQLMGAMRELASQGYDRLADSAKAAGKVMSEDTVVQLAEAQKALKDLRDKMTISVGSVAGAGLKIGAAAKSDFFGTAWDVIKAGFSPMLVGDLATRLVANEPAPVPVKPAAPIPPAPASAEAILRARILASTQAAAEIQNASLLTETHRREALLPILDRQLKFYEELVKTRYADVPENPADTMTEEQLQRWQQYAEIRAKIAAIRESKQQVNDTPFNRLSREFSDTGAIVTATVDGAMRSAISGLSTDIWGAMKRTNSLGAAFTNLGEIAGRALTEMMVKLYLIQPLLNWLAPGGLGSAGAISSVGSYALGGGSPVPSLASGSAFTPLAGATATFSVPGRASGGDVEAGRMYNVNEKGYPEVFIPRVSGRISPSAMSLGGEGKGRGGASIVVQQTINVSTGVQETVRAEIVGMLPALRSSSVDALRDAIARNEIQVG